MNQTPQAHPGKAIFERQVQNLEPGMAGRLRAARRAALAGAGPSLVGQGVLARRWWLPAGVAAGLVLALCATRWRAPTSAPVAEESLEIALYAEDPAVYDWLADAPVADDGLAEGLH